MSRRGAIVTVFSTRELKKRTELRHTFASIPPAKPNFDRVLLYVQQLLLKFGMVEAVSGRANLYECSLRFTVQSVDGVY